MNKKQNIPPPIGSRTNSNQPLPRTKPTLNSKQTPSAGPSSSKKTKHKKHTESSKSPKSSSLTDRIIVILLAIFTVYALWTCPSDTHLSNPLCRSLSQYKTHVLDPYVLPPIHKVLSHPSIAPTISKLHDAERVVSPVIRRTHAAAQPYITKATELTHTVYARSIQPYYRKYVYPQYKRHVLPRVRLVRSRVIDPYWTPFSFKAHQYTNKILVIIHRIYLAVAPRVQAIYVRTQPFLQQAWEGAKPHATKVTEMGATSFGLALEKGAEAKRQFVDPHIIRIWAKVVELSGTSVTSSISVAAASTSTIAEEIKATSLEVEPETVQSISSSAPSATTSTLSVLRDSSSEAASVPEEASLPAETVEEATLSSAASVMQTSSTIVATTETPPTEIEVEAEADIEPEVVAEEVIPAQEDVEAEAEIEPEVVVEEAIPAQEDVEAEAKAEPELEVVEEDVLEDFFAELGLLETEEPEPSIVEDEPVETTPLTPEESAAARKAKTAEKRAKIEADLEQWQLDIDALIKRRTKAFRKEMVRVRKGAVRALFPDPEKGDNSDLEVELTHVRGEDVAGILGRFEKESEKLLKGLETYLKKEEKIASGMFNFYF